MNDKDSPTVDLRAEREKRCLKLSSELTTMARYLQGQGKEIPARCWRSRAAVLGVSKLRKIA